MRRWTAITLGTTQKIDVDDLAPVLTVSRPVSWRALVIANVAVHLAVGIEPVATVGSILMPTTARPPFIINIAANERLSILGVGPGSAWITEVR